MKLNYDLFSVDICMRGLINLETIQLLLERKIAPHHLPLIQAKEQGLFEKNGINLNIIEPDLPFGGLERLGEDEVDIALGLPLFVLFRYLSNKNITALAHIFVSQAGVFYCNDKKLDDITAIGPEHQIYFRGGCRQLAGQLLETMVERAGGTVPEDLNLTADKGDGLEKLIAGEIDVLFPGDLAFDGVWLNMAGAKVECHFFTDAQLPETGELVVAASDQMVENYPNIIQSFISTLHSSIQQVKENPIEALSLFSEKYPDLYPAQKLEMLWQSERAALTTDFPQSFNLYTRWGEWLNENTDLDAYLDLDSLIDERFLPFELLDF
jgi:putative hydroxymethylpyrimidine transport system substrate-binding protein